MHYLAGSGGSGGSTTGGLILWAVLIAAYWVPSFIAWRRHVPGIGQVVVVNFFAFTVIGWVVALVMAFRHVPETPPAVSGSAGG